LRKILGPEEEKEDGRNLGYKNEGIQVLCRSLAITKKMRRGILRDDRLNM
jgi:hypothetical protein